MNKMNTLGTTELVYIDNELADGVIAKIDTGADSSSIWASDVTESDGTLSYKLFAPGSAYYSGKEYKTSEYSVIYVKNSFGHGENRYKVRLNITIGGKRHNVLFSLANRSRNKYPILIGRKFLKNRFVVDVAKKHNDELQDDTILVLVTKVTDEIKDFFAEVQKTAVSKIVLSSYNNLQFIIDENGFPKILLPDGFDIANSKFVYFKSYSFCLEQALAAAKYLAFKHVNFFDKEVSNGLSRSKLSELFVLSTHGVMIPQTTVVGGRKNIPSFDDIEHSFGVPFIIKDACSDRGKNNYLVSDLETYTEAINRLKDAKIKLFVIQKFIPNDGFLRVLLLDGKVAQVVFRKTAIHKDSLRAHLNKPHGGNNASEVYDINLFSEPIALAQRGSIALGRNVAGVDLVQDKHSKKWYVLEVNYNPEMISGFGVDKKAEGLAKMLDHQF